MHATDLLEQADLLDGPDTGSPAQPEIVMGTFSFYDDAGRIVMVSTVDRSLCDLIAAGSGGLRWIEGSADFATDYVANGVITPRPQNPATLDGTRLSNLPIPCTVIINGIEHECDDGWADLEFDQPGSYTVIVTEWPYLDKEFTVENPA
ncbi:hypothetical protein [Bordetella sp. LUAb4]|uniref:hypothetical protein n=1 Tax=Bordetella sp. LUAb4 TaxID=2843195 RepID=UPI001E616ECA|nr:hypothetical protein [Bordetella sp. LUAb4]